MNYAKLFISNQMRNFGILLLSFLNAIKRLPKSKLVFTRGYTRISTRTVRVRNSWFVYSNIADSIPAVFSCSQNQQSGLSGWFYLPFCFSFFRADDKSLLPFCRLRNRHIFAGFLHASGVETHGWALRRGLRKTIAGGGGRCDNERERLTVRQDK